VSALDWPSKVLILGLAPPKSADQGPAKQKRHVVGWPTEPPLMIK
jgi:hypothetical protein